MAKLKILDFNNFKFETELASELFYTKNDNVRVALKCVVKPITNEVEYFVLVDCAYCTVGRFVFLEDAIVYYNSKLEKLKEETYGRHEVC